MTPTPDAAPGNDRAWMKSALALAQRGQGRVWPNPSVGCVIVSDGRCVGRGRTADGGRPHAETEALAMAGPAARGATAYVTLEPCAHQGQTPPCASALIAAGVARVVYASPDPDPRVNGAGAAMLRNAGVAVCADVHRDAADLINAGFLTRTRLGRPHLTLKLATTLDGRIAMANGESRWITGPAARRATHLLRSRSDGLMVGHGTVIADDPMLDVRDMGRVPQPIRIVVSTNGALGADTRLARSARIQPVWIVAASGSAPDPMVTILAKRTGTGLDMTDALRQLGARGLTRVLCEGGGRLAASLLDADLVDQIVLFQAGFPIGAGGVPSIGDLGFGDLATIPRFALSDTTAIGPDTLSMWHRIRPAA